MKRLIYSSIRFSSIVVICAVYPIRVLAEDPFQFFQEEAKATADSRWGRPLEDIPMAVDVISTEEIRASGAVNLWDLLRFRAGMDVLDARSINGSRAIVAVRGFPQEFVRDLQVLIDGRSVYEPIRSQVYWDQLPVQIQDIERIEIIRGPNSALYGSGAGLGVINIVTRKPQGPTMATAESFGGNQGTFQTGESFESSLKKLAYRLSYNFRQQDGFPEVSGARENDFLNSHKANLRTNWTPGEGSQLELFAGGSWNRDGAVDDARAQDHFQQHFEMLKFKQKVSDHSTVEILSSRSDYTNDIETSGGPSDPSDVDSRVLQYDEEILQRFDWGGNRLKTVYGFNYRGVSADSSDLFANTPQHEDLWSGYFNQMIGVTDHISISGGASWESSNVGDGGIESNYQVAPEWTPWSNHTFRASYAVSHAIPSLYNSTALQLRDDGILFTGNPDLKPQKLTSYEVGYRGRLDDKRFQMDASLYYTVLKDIDNIVETSPTTIGFANVDEAIARGVETEFKYRLNQRASIYLNYTFEEITDHTGDAGDGTENTPDHKLNFGGLADLGHGFSGSLNVGYKDKYFIDSDGHETAAAIPAYWRLDARLAYAVNQHLELFMSGQNLAALTHQEFPDGLAIPRTYQGGVTLKWGGRP